MDYVDDSMHKVLEDMMPEMAKLAWLRMRDERTRAHMAHLINEGMPGGEALRASWRAHAHLWDMEDRTVAAPTQPDGAMDVDDYSSSSRQPAPRSAPEKRQLASDMGGVKQSAVDSRKRKICGVYNGKKSCTFKGCQMRHVCNIVNPQDGTVCEGRFGNPKHNAYTCPLVNGKRCNR